MAISARNQLNATIKHIQSGAVNDVIKLSLTDGDELTAVIASESTKRLTLLLAAAWWRFLKPHQSSSQQMMS